MTNNRQQLNSIKRRNTFTRALAGFFITAIAIVLAGLVWFWGFLGRYERATPEAALTDFTQLVKSGSYEEIFEHSKFKITEHNLKENYIEILKKLYPQNTQELQYQKIASKEGKKLYAVYADGNDSGTIELIPSDNKKENALVARVILNGFTKVTIIAPEYVSVYINGNELSREDAQKSAEPIKYFKNLTDALRPYNLTYVHEELLTKPTVSAKTPEGEDCAVVETNTGLYEVTVVPTQEELSQYSALIENGAKTYASFVSRDKGLTDVYKLSWQDTQFTKALKGFSNQWYIDHDSYVFENMKIKNVYEYSENTFMGEISFDHVILRGTKRNVYPSSYRMIFLKQDNVWKIYDLQVL